MKKQKNQNQRKNVQGKNLQDTERTNNDRDQNRNAGFENDQMRRGGKGADLNKKDIGNEQRNRERLQKEDMEKKKISEGSTMNRKGDQYLDEIKNRRERRQQ
jgi:hypothetical protein